MTFYWELITKDDSVYEIPPQAVDVVKKRMNNHDPINLSSATIPFSEIKAFRASEKPFTTTPLLEAASQAFNEPMLNDDGSIVGKWVKKTVPNRLYTKHHAHVPSYKFLNNDGGMTEIAFFLPVHEINHTLTECTESEVRQLTR